MAREITNPDGLITPSDRGAKYNYLITEDGHLYHAGQVGRNKDGTHVVESFEAQARKTLDNVGELLRAVDKDFSDVNKVTTYFTDIGRDLDRYSDEIWTEYFDEPYPCHTALGVDRLSYEELLIEVEVELPVGDESS